MPHKADTSVNCQCGAVISKYYYRTHIQTAKHEHEMQGCENIDVVDHKYKHTYVCVYIRMYVLYICMYVCIYVYVCMYVCIRIHVCVCVCVCVCV